MATVKGKNTKGKGAKGKGAGKQPDLFSSANQKASKTYNYPVTVKKDKAGTVFGKYVDDIKKNASSKNTKGNTGIVKSGSKANNSKSVAELIKSGKQNANASGGTKLLSGSKASTALAKGKKLSDNIKYTDYEDVTNAVKKGVKGTKDIKGKAMLGVYGAALLTAIAAGGGFSGDTSKKKSDSKAKDKDKTKAKAETKKDTQKPTNQKAKQEKAKNTQTKKEDTTPKKESFDLDTEVKNVMRGKYGTGAARKAALGDNYAKVQAEINKRMASAKPKSTPAKETPKAAEAPEKMEIRRPGSIDYTGPKELAMTAEQRMYQNMDKLKESQMKKGGMVKMKRGGQLPKASLGKIVKSGVAAVSKYVNPMVSSAKTNVKKASDAYKKAKQDAYAKKTAHLRRSEDWENFANQERAKKIARTGVIGLGAVGTAAAIADKAKSTKTSSTGNKPKPNTVAKPNNVAAKRVYSASAKPVPTGRSSMASKPMPSGVTRATSSVTGKPAVKKKFGGVMKTKKR